MSPAAAEFADEIDRAFLGKALQSLDDMMYADTIPYDGEMWLEDDGKGGYYCPQQYPSDKQLLWVTYFQIQEKSLIFRINEIKADDFYKYGPTFEE
jgi:hypothetical protein